MLLVDLSFIFLERQMDSFTLADHAAWGFKELSTE